MLALLRKFIRNGNGTLKKETFQDFIEAIKNESYTSVDVKIFKIATGCGSFEEKEEIFSYFIEILAKGTKTKTAVLSIEYKNIRESNGDIFDIKNYVHKLDIALLLIQKIKNETPTIEIKIIAEKRFLQSNDWEEISKRLNIIPSSEEGIFLQ